MVGFCTSKGSRRNGGFPIGPQMFVYNAGRRALWQSQLGASAASITKRAVVISYAPACRDKWRSDPPRAPALLQWPLRLSVGSTAPSHSMDLDLSCSG